MFAEDLNVFLSNDEHAQEIVVIDTQEIITAIVDQPYSDSLDIQGFAPSLIMKTSEAANRLSRGYRMEIGSQVLRVGVLEPDGTGITRVILEAE